MNSHSHCKYIYMDFFHHHWKDISEMVDENYSKYLGHKDSLIIGACTMHSVNDMKHVYPNSNRYIVYQLEPLYENHWHPVSKIINNMQGADEVWDYDMDNIKVLKSYGIDAKFRPFLYTETLNRVPKVDNLDIDILFYGTLSRERYNILFEILHECGMKYNLVTLWNIDGVRLDEFIARSKVILDLQTSSEKNIQKQSRIYQVLCNNKCVVSEKSKRNYYGDFIIESQRQYIASTLLDVLDSRIWEQKTSSRLDLKFKAFSQKFLGNIS